MPVPIHLAVFEDIARLDDDQVKEIIARVGRDDLTIALKAATEPLKDKILGNMSEEEREALTQYGPSSFSKIQHNILLVLVLIAALFAAFEKAWPITGHAW